MYTIKNNTTNTYTINNSKFITYMYKIDNIEKVNNHMNEIKKLHPHASHYTYAYIIDNIIKYSDDKEPTNTAGKPIKEVLLKNKLNNILCIVVRYFGGIKLGVGGLTRAYVKSVTTTLDITPLVKLEQAKYLIITFKYEYLKYIDSLLQEELIKEKYFTNQITYHVITKNTNLINKIKNIKDIIIEEEKNTYIDSL